jgi:hypothetical protein
VNSRNLSFAIENPQQCCTTSFSRAIFPRRQLETGCAGTSNVMHSRRDARGGDLMRRSSIYARFAEGDLPTGGATSSTRAATCIYISTGAQSVQILFARGITPRTRRCTHKRCVKFVPVHAAAGGEPAAIIGVSVSVGCRILQQVERFPRQPSAVGLLTDTLSCETPKRRVTETTTTTEALIARLPVQQNYR